MDTSVDRVRPAPLPEREAHAEGLQDRIYMEKRIAAFFEKTFEHGEGKKAPGGNGLDWKTFQCNTFLESKCRFRGTQNHLLCQPVHPILEEVTCS